MTLVPVIHFYNTGLSEKVQKLQRNKCKAHEAEAIRYSVLKGTIESSDNYILS